MQGFAGQRVMSVQKASGVVAADRPAAKEGACASRKARHTASVPHTLARSATTEVKSKGGRGQGGVMERHGSRLPEWDDVG